MPERTTASPASACPDPARIATVGAGLSQLAAVTLLAEQGVAVTTGTEGSVGLAGVPRPSSRPAPTAPRRSGWGSAFPHRGALFYAEPGVQSIPPAARQPGGRAAGQPPA
ncbi:hypothetical protein [Streptomyces sp. HUAS TT3]|uniref:hypothetical protein n=1 Tax=Streptomyces sp. HUAS TT3 TaxID=3447510 RepID=UPI003F656E68